MQRERSEPKNRAGMKPRASNTYLASSTLICFNYVLLDEQSILTACFWFTFHFIEIRTQQGTWH